eukprot:4079-Heterococcus_DN1.PRE.7
MIALSLQQQGKVTATGVYTPTLRLAVPYAVDDGAELILAVQPGPCFQVKSACVEGPLVVVKVRQCSHTVAICSLLDTAAAATTAIAAALPYTVLHNVLHSMKCRTTKLPTLIAAAGTILLCCSCQSAKTTSTVRLAVAHV